MRSKGRGEDNGKDEFYRLRLRMVKDQIERRGIKDRRVIEAMIKVPRHLFVDESMRARAYVDSPLPIGEGQTISQPYIVALMTEALELTGKEKVLEIGTGSGYQLAILAELADEVYSVERIPSLAARAEKLLLGMGYKNIFVRVGDGTLGWSEKAPFDAIIVTAAAPDVPNSLKEQLAEGGRLVIPVGGEYTQSLLKVTKVGYNKFHTEDLGGVRFVKLIGKQGWEF